MFHTLITTAYIIPNIYVFLRLYYSFIERRYRIHYIVVYLLLAAIYPASEWLPDQGLLTGILSAISDYLLPFYLYLFLSVITFDIFLLVNLLFKIVPTEKFRNAAFRRTALPAILSLSILVVIAGAVNFSMIRMSEYNITIPKKSSDLDHMRIAFIADFHLREGKNVRFLKRFAERIAEIKPDILLMGGDIADDRRVGRGMKEFERILRGIDTKYGVFGVLGNHEYYTGNDKSNFFSESGIRVLYDTVIIVSGAINLAGRYDSHFRERKSIDELLMTAADSLPVILLDHRPTDIDRVSRTAVDIQLSGHTHNGQLFPINYIIKSMYELSWGYMTKGDSHFFVTSGLQLWGPPVRTAGKAEIMVINVTFQEQE
jgi:predicted MPP superfamily phosphohydrolase